MPDSLYIVNERGVVRELAVMARPHTCPRCGNYNEIKVIAAVQTGDMHSARKDAIGVGQCPRIDCRAHFAIPYTIVMENGIEKAGLLSHRPLEYVATTDYSEAIERLSPVFCETYAQSLRAEENGLTQICGTGYRRALEYLVKDFALLKTEPTDDARRKVMKMLLAHCIREYLPEQIQEAAKRAAWLGNDETHYYRSWSGQDVNNLKSLITLTAKAIDFTLELEKYVQTMPEGKK